MSSIHLSLKYLIGLVYIYMKEIFAEKIVINIKHIYKTKYQNIFTWNQVRMFYLVKISWDSNLGCKWKIARFNHGFPNNIYEMFLNYSVGFMKCCRLLLLHYLCQIYNNIYNKETLKQFARCWWLTGSCKCVIVKLSISVAERWNLKH